MTTNDAAARLRKSCHRFRACKHFSLSIVIDDVTAVLDRLEAAERERDEQRKWKETAYTERAKLVALLTRLFPAYIAQHDSNDASWDREWLTIVFVQLPTGQASWHIHLNDIPLFDHLKDGENNWDGHKTEEKYQRVLAVRADMLDGWPMWRRPVTHD